MKCFLTEWLVTNGSDWADEKGTRGRMWVGTATNRVVAWEEGYLERRKLSYDDETEYKITEKGKDFLRIS